MGRLGQVGQHEHLEALLFASAATLASWLNLSVVDVAAHRLARAALCAGPKSDVGLGVTLGTLLRCTRCLLRMLPVPNAHCGLCCCLFWRSWTLRQTSSGWYCVVGALGCKLLRSGNGLGGLGGIGVLFSKGCLWAAETAEGVWCIGRGCRSNLLLSCRLKQL